MWYWPRGLGARVELVILSRDLHREGMQDLIAKHSVTGDLPDKAFCKVPKSEEYAAESPLSDDALDLITLIN